MRFVSLCFMMLLVVQPSIADKFDETKIITTHVAGNIYMLEGAGGAIGVSAGADGLLIVDDQFAPLANKIAKALEKIAKGELKFILNTHYHGDHTGGNEYFGKKATIISHDNVRKRLLVDEKPPYPKDALPIITFEHGVNIHFNDDHIKVMHMEGHTDGDSVVWFKKSAVVHMGDLFFKDLFPYVDMESGGSIEGYIQSINDILAIIPDDIHIIAGHGGLGNKLDLQRYLLMLKSTRDIVLTAYKKGVNLEGIIKQGLGEQWKDWGKGFITEERWIKFLYRSASTTKSIAYQSEVHH